jgi:Concanavalin A-like lectin/glucanases superfamily
MRTWMAVGGTVLLLTTACGGSGPDGQGGTPPPSSASGSGSVTRSELPLAHMGDPDLWLSFDEDAGRPDGPPAYADALGRGHHGVVVVGNAGSVESVPGAPDRGLAVAFPPPCAADRGCPRALVEIASDPSLDPGSRPFAYGASVRLSPGRTAVGSNIVQQGRFGTTGGQWKLQVDNRAGQPSCVIRSGPDVVAARSSVSIADGEWHRVTCRRDEDGVSVDVDGTVRRADGGAGAVGSSWPIRIGSPGVGDLDDQFHGLVDDVFLDIDPGP